MTEMKKMKVMIVEDHLVARMGLRTLIDHQSDMQVVEEARSGSEAVERYGRAKPDVVLMDLRLPVLDGIAATELIVKVDASARVLVFSSFDAETDLVRAHAAGARGYVLKSADAQDLLAAIRDVFEGRKHFPQALNDRLDQGTGPELNTRERELLLYLVKGLNNREIAEVSDLTRGTVRIYLTRLFAKLQVSNRTEAVTAAFERGLVKPEWAQAGRR